MMQGGVGRGGSIHPTSGGRLQVAGVGKALCIGSAITAAGGVGVTAAASLGAGIGVPAAHAVAVFSLLARTRTAPDRVRPRMMLLAASVAGGGLHHLVLGQLASSPRRSSVLSSVVELLAVAGLTVCLGLGLAGLVVAVADGGTTLVWLRRLLDGWMIAGSLLTLSWVLLMHRADQGGDVSGSLLGLARVVTDILVLGLLVALRFGLRRGSAHRSPCRPWPSSSWR